ncbi:MAG TPA: GAF domain-containing protein [Coriobacteriia bacterium]
MDRQRPRSRARGSDGRPSSGFRLFNAVIVIRWLSLAVASIGYVWNLISRQLDYGHFVPALAAALAYTLALSLFSRRLYGFHSRSRMFLVIDYTFSFVLWAVTGAVWSPFLIFCACSALFAGLHGGVRAGAIGGAGLVASFAVALWVKGQTFPILAAGDGLELALTYSSEFAVFPIGWAYAAGLVADLDAACRKLAVSRDVLARANRILDDRQQELLALSRIRAAILSTPHAGEILRTVLDALASTGFPGCSVWLLEDGALMEFPSDQHPAAIGEGSDEPVAVAVRRREVVHAAASPASPASPARGPAVAVPIASADEVYGALVVHETTRGPFEREAVELLTLFADEIALALQHTHMYEQAREYALVEERNRVSVELSETVVGKLDTAEKSARALQREDVPPDVARKLALLEETMHKALEDLHLAVLNWTSLEWDDRPRQLAERYANEFTVLSGIPVALTVLGDERPLAPAKAKDLLRVLQESLSNAWRHACTPSVRVELEFAPDGVVLAVCDDGCGYDPSVAAHGAGIGLKSMAERGRRHGGCVDVTSAPGEGTQVRMWMPW